MTNIQTTQQAINEGLLTCPRCGRKRAKVHTVRAGMLRYACQRCGKAGAVEVVEEVSK